MDTMMTAEQLGAAALDLEIPGHRTKGMKLSYQLWRNSSTSNLKYRLQVEGIPLSPTGKEETFRLLVKKQENSLEVLRMWVRSLAPAIAMLTETIQRQDRIQYFLTRIAGQLVDIAKEDAPAEVEPIKVINDLRPIPSESNMFMFEAVE